MLLSVREVATLLEVSEREVYRWVDEGEIPFQRVRQEVRFNRSDLLEWATTRRMPVSLAAFDADLEPGDRAPSLAAALRVGGVHADVPAADREAALEAIVERTPMPPSADRELILAVLAAREQTSATAIGGGIAIPHVRQPIVAPGAVATASVSYLRTPLPFDAPDGQPVDTIFLLVSPTIRTHLQMLAHVTRALLDEGFRAALDRRAPVSELAAETERLEATQSSSTKTTPSPAAPSIDD